MRHWLMVFALAAGQILWVGTPDVMAQTVTDSLRDRGRGTIMGPPVIDSIDRHPTAPAPTFVLTPYNAIVWISVRRRMLWVVAGRDTLLRAPVSVASGRSFTFAGTQWHFATPRGRHVVRAKRTAPTWTPPDWHYAEVAARHHLTLRRLPMSGWRLRNGSRLVVRDSVVGLIPAGDTAFLALPTGEHVVFESTLFIPPLATLNRQLQGELGEYALDIGDGYMLHGTSDQTTIGRDGTHGCIRLGEADLRWLYRYLPTGITVYIHE